MYACRKQTTTLILEWLTFKPTTFTEATNQIPRLRSMMTMMTMMTIQACPCKPISAALNRFRIQKTGLYIFCYSV